LLLIGDWRQSEALRSPQTSLRNLEFRGRDYLSELMHHIRDKARQFPLSIFSLLPLLFFLCYIILICQPPQVTMDLESSCFDGLVVTKVVPQFLLVRRLSLLLVGSAAQTKLHLQPSTLVRRTAFSCTYRTSPWPIIRPLPMSRQPAISPTNRRRRIQLAWSRS